MCGSFRTKESVDITFLAYISPFHFLAPTTTLAPHRHRPRGSPMTCLSTQPLNACFGVVLWVYGIGTERSVPEKMMDLTIVDDETTDCCSWRLRFCPSIGRIGSDCDRIQINSRDPSASLPPCTCGVVENWLIV